MSSESTSSDSKVESGPIWSDSAPNSSSAVKTRCSSSSRVTVVDIGLSFLGGQSAIHGKQAAGHVSSLLGGQEAHARGHLLRRSHPPRGHQLKQALVETLGHVRLD